MSDVLALALEASTERFSLAARHGARVESFEAMPARTATAAVFEHAGRLLGRFGAGFADLGYVAFGCGPGSFTGVRVVAAAAQALAYGRGIPVCRVSSLAVLAAGACRNAGPGLYAICIDARMGRAYAALYRVEDPARPLPAMAEALVDPAAFVFPGSEPFVALGDGWQAQPSLHERHHERLRGLRPDILPSAADLLSMAALDFAAGRTVGPAEALPEYLGQAPASRPVSPE